MTDEEKKIEQRLMPWRFWLLTLLSVSLVVFFVYYLPLRFMFNAMIMHMNTGVYREANTIEKGFAIDLTAPSSMLSTGKPITFDFFVNQKPVGTPVPYTGLELEHAKLMHVLGVRDDLEGFFHVHPYPTDSPGHFTRDIAFSIPGRYKIWSQVTTTTITYTFGHEPITVKGSGEVRKSNNHDFTRKITVGGYDVTLAAPAQIAKRRTTSIAFDIHAANGNEIRLEDYLGATMHLAIIKDDWTQFMHAHPDDGSGMMMHSSAPFRLINEAYADGTHTGGDFLNVHGVPFQIKFPEAGIYRVFAQFRPLGIRIPPDEAITAMFWIKVDETAPQVARINPKTSWLWLLVVSILASIFLSRGVKNYLGKRLEYKPPALP